jgi:hypothetical protein
MGTFRPLDIGLNRVLKISTKISWKIEKGMSRLKKPAAEAAQRR